MLEIIYVDGVSIVILDFVFFVDLYVLNRFYIEECVIWNLICFISGCKLFLYYLIEVCCIGLNSIGFMW